MKAVILKPDEIGDFVLATGAIRLAAAEYGEKNILLVVKSEIVPLARREFPHARVLALPLLPKRRGINKDAVNIVRCIPAWLRLCFAGADSVVCLRSMRDFIQSVVFITPRARRRIACENSMMRTRSARHRAFDAALVKLFRPQILPYPEPAEGLPSDLGANRAVVSALLGREVAREEILPRLSSARWRGGDFWLFCPFSSARAKDYDAENWAAALRAVEDIVPPGGVRVAGGPDQAVRIDEFARRLRALGVGCPVHVDRSKPLDEFLDTVAGAAMVLTVDTAAAHMACACGAPAVIVACGMHPGVYGPYSADGRQRWLVGDWGTLGRKGWQKSVPPADVAAAIRSGLAGGR